MLRTITLLIYYKKSFADFLTFKNGTEIVLVYIHYTSLFQGNSNRGIL